MADSVVIALLIVGPVPWVAGFDYAAVCNKTAYGRVEL